MSSTTHLFRSTIVMLGIMTLLIGCGTPNDNAIYNSDTGHPAGWLPAKHVSYASSGTTSMGAAIPSTGQCVGCHGADLKGGISNVSCSSCHIGGPTSMHPTTWTIIVLNHAPSLTSGATSAAQCANQYCHGANLTGVAGSGPACSKCHTWPFTAGSVTCGSCHGIPPSGNRYPNVAGRHAVHSSFGVGCADCHFGSDGASGVGHYSNVLNVAVDTTKYNAKTGAAAFNATSSSCSQVSCHGGQTTPSWFSGSIDVNTQCTICHAYGTTQYNSFNSGQHNRHVNQQGIACTECHDTTKLTAVHFNDLNTTAMNEAALTIRNALNYTGAAGAPATGNCTINCHGENHSNRSW